MRVIKPLALIILTVLIFSFPIKMPAQLFQESEPTASKFPITRGSGDPNYNGTLDLTIPLLKIPGRGGLDYDINLIYVDGNGVAASESESWVGLGWNLNMYQITCSPAFATTGDDAGGYGITGQDLYYLTYPGGSTPIYKFSDNEWRPLKWSAIKITADDMTASDNDSWGITRDYKRFTVTDENGTKYIYETRLRQISDISLANHNKFSSENYPYNSVFKLSRILGADYADGNNDDIPGNGGTDYGSYINFSYTIPVTISYFISTRNIKIELSYLTSVNTPTHSATFETVNGSRFIYQGKQYGSSADLQKLKSIKVDNGVEKVEFDNPLGFSWAEIISGELQSGGGIYHELVSASGGGSSSSNVLRARLNSISIAKGGEVQTYKFGYNPNPTTTQCFVDGWGYYRTDNPLLANPNPDFVWGCWLLNKVTYPTGAVTEYSYETNKYLRYATGEVKTPVLKSLGGVRLEKQTSTDPQSGEVLITSYDYALTNKLHPEYVGYGFISLEPAENEIISSFAGLKYTIGRQPSFAKNIHNDVHYPDIQITYPDGSRIRRYYTSAFSEVFYNEVNSQERYRDFEKSYKYVTIEDDPYISSLPITTIQGGQIYEFFKFEIDDDNNNPKEVPKNSHFNMKYPDKYQVFINNGHIDLSRFFQGESSEFGDEYNYLLCNVQDSKVSMFDNSWKRGYLTREEYYMSTDQYTDMGEEGTMEEVYRKQYSYTMTPVKTDQCTVKVNYKTSIGTNGIATSPTFITSGWVKQTRIDHISRGIDVLSAGLLKTEKFEYNRNNGLISKQTEEGTSEDGSRVTYYAYASDFATYSDMKTRHMLSQKLYTARGNSQSTFCTNQGTGKILNDELAQLKGIASLTQTLWSANKDPLGKGRWFIDKNLSWKDTKDIDGYNNYDITDVNITTQEYLTYDQNGNVLKVKDANGVSSIVKWNSNGTLPAATFKNAESGEASFLDFEDYSIGDWSGIGIDIINDFQPDSHTGSSGLHLNSSTRRGLNKYMYASQLDVTGKYLLSGWVYSDSEGPVLQLDITYKDQSGHIIEYMTEAFATAKPGGAVWEYLELPVDLSKYPGLVKLELFALNNSSKGTADCVWDDIRFIPADAQMRSMTYNSFNQITSISDANSIPRHFTYGSGHRLTQIRNNNLDVLSQYSYYLAGDYLSEYNPNSITTKLYRSPEDYTTLREYFDGFGQSIQSQTNIGTEDIISHKTYDNMGRLSKVYKPYMAPVAHTYDTDYFDNSINYYSQKCGIDLGSYPYSETEYWKDPLNRPKSQSAPGDEFCIDSDHKVNYSYEIKSGNVQRTTDENGLVTETRTNTFGQTAESISDPKLFCGYQTWVINPKGLDLKTSLLYDVLGNLILSKPPKGYEENTEIYNTTYKYNTLSLLTQKTSPDAGTVKYLYDMNGNLRLIKDANHDASAINNVNFSNSIAYNGSRTENFSLSNKGRISLTLNGSHLAFSSGTVTIKILGPNNATLYTLTINASNPYATGTVALPKLPSGTNYSYNISSSANITLGYQVQCIKNFDFVYNKYDKLNRLIETGEYETSSLSDFSQNNASNTDFPSSNGQVSKQYFYDNASSDPMASGQRNLKGRLSYTMSFRPGNAANLAENNVTFYSYDRMGRVEWTVQRDMGWYQKKLTYTYDLSGNVIQKGYTDYDWRSGSFYTAYTYDEAGRLCTVKTSPNSNMSGSTQEALYKYLANGNINRLELGTYQSRVVQGVDYRYNARDWLTAINSPTLNPVNDPGNDGITNGVFVDKFGMAIGYNIAAGSIGDPSSQNTAPQWNGNISWLSYQISGANYTNAGTTTALVGWTYSYNGANRLLSANFGYNYNNRWLPTFAYDESGYTYDPAGNINSLQRYGKDAAIIDNLTYNYIAGKNQLDYVADASSSGGLDSQSPGNYTYDANGNALCDKKNDIAFIIYDLDNLPLFIYKINGIFSLNSYDVNGNRVRKVLSTGSDTYYVNSPDGKTEVVDLVPYGYSFTYNILGNDNIGQVRVNNGTYSRYYYLKDHIGSIRATVNSAGEVDSYNDYYPFGGIMDGRSHIAGADKRYRFTGKERDDETGLDYFGARFYDSRIGRWLSVDPLAEKYPGWSPYNYCANNPLKFTDPNGEDIKPVTKSDAEKWKITQNKLMLSKEGRNLLSFYKKLPYDVALSYTQLPTKVLGQIDITYTYKEDAKTDKRSFTKAHINKIELDDTKKGYDDVATPAEELSHGKDATKDPNTYYNNKQNATSYETNQNEINGKENAQKVKDEYEKAQNENKADKDNKNDQDKRSN